MSDPEETTLALARVLIEAGEVDAALDWMEDETYAIYDNACLVLNDPDADPDEKRRAHLVTRHLGQMFKELSDLANGTEERGES